MKTMYIVALFLVLALTATTGLAQTDFGFTYDDSGNRITRAVIELKSARVIADSLQAKKDLQSLEDQIGLQKTRIYPNPTKGLLRIDFPGLTEQKATIRVFDPNGRLIIQKPGAERGNEVDLSAYPTGFYIMTICSGTEKKEWKIIKE